MLLSLVTAVVSAQKITIKTANGQKVEISCDGMVPNQVIVVNDSVILKMNPGMIEANKDDFTASVDEEPDSVDTFVSAELDEEATDSIITVAPASSFSGSNPSALSLIANGIAEELDPEYAEFNRLHENDNPSSEKEVIKNVAKQFLDEDVVETADFLTTLFSNIRFTKDSLFKPEYSLRKPKKLYRTYDIIQLNGSFGQNINSASNKMSDVIEEGNYGDDLENNNKFGGGAKYSHVYIKGSEVDGQWQPNLMGLAWSWGGLIDYSYEKDMGSYFSIMGKFGVQIGNEITFGIDALAGYGVIPYNSFFTNGYQHAVVNKSVFGFKCGLELWGSLNFYKNTYTAFYGRYIRSIKPNQDGDILDDWSLIYADFDPSNWSLGLAVGYKFGAPKPLSQDKRLQASINTGYSLTDKESFLCAELEKMTQVSKSTYLNYGLHLERTFRTELSSLMFTAGFKVKQPGNSWFWGTKILGGIGQYNVGFSEEKSGSTLNATEKKLCSRGALQLNSGFDIGKLSEIFAGIRAGYHFGNPSKTEDGDDVSYSNLNGFDLSVLLGFKFTF